MRKAEQVGRWLAGVRKAEQVAGRDEEGRASAGRVRGWWLLEKTREMTLKIAFR